MVITTKVNQDKTKIMVMDLKMDLDLEMDLEMEMVMVMVMEAIMEIMMMETIKIILTINLKMEALQ